MKESPLQFYVISPRQWERLALYIARQGYWWDETPAWRAALAVSAKSLTWNGVPVVTHRQMLGLLQP